MPHTRRQLNPLSDRLSELRLSSGSPPSRTRTRYNASDEVRRPLLDPEEEWEVAVTSSEAIDGQDRSTGSLFTTVGSGTTGTTTAGEEEEEEVEGVAVHQMGRPIEDGRLGRREKNWAQRTRESYCLQMTLAARVSRLATLAEDRTGPDICGVSPDSATVSYRLWV